MADVLLHVITLSLKKLWIHTHIDDHQSLVHAPPHS